MSLEHQYVPVTGDTGDKQKRRGHNNTIIVPRNADVIEYRNAREGKGKSPDIELE